jgi:predicted AAA+ superfamily ATPase
LHHIAGNLDSRKTSFIDFEDRDELSLFTHDIKAFAELHVKGQDYLLLDEFHYAPDGGKNLKFLYDHFSAKILITGSSATELSIQSIRYLVGRIFVFNLYPLTFEEVLAYQEPKLHGFLSKRSEPGPEIIERINRYYAAYLIYGGYPRVVLSPTNEEKKMVIKNIFNTYLLREVKQILNYPDEFKLTKLIQALALQIGGTVNYNELSTLTGFKYKELHEAISILEKTFIIARSIPYYRNKRVELVKSPKFFFLDNGFRNVAINNFLPLSSRPDAGALNENFVATELINRDYQLRYWRTKSKAEVDFIVEDQNEIIPVEVKTHLNQIAVARSFRSFLDKYSPSRGFVASNSLLKKTTIAKTSVSFVPHWYVRI